MTAVAQKPQARITAEVVNSNRALIQGSALPRARADNDAGKVASDMKLQGMSFVFSRSDAQSAALETLIAAQQNPSSPLYHQWLTPDQFASRFGAADADIAKVEGWLQQEGFTVDHVSRSRDRITFSGTAAQVEVAFGAPIHYFTTNGDTHFAPLGSLSVPAAFSASILTIGNVSDFRPKAHVKFMTPETVKANFTSSQSGSHFVTPKDVATIYDINAAYNAGYTGTNQSIAIVGQSSVVLTDISNFQTAAGLTVKAPTPILVPGSGTTASPVTGDEGESDLDLEYSGGIAKGATIYFVYTGNNQNYGVFDSLQYAVDERLSPIISSSYGECETALGAADYASLNAILQQASTQGQTVIAAAGDDGSTDCYEQTGLTSAQQLALAVDFPASSQYVTGMGGTEYLAADVATGNTTYWTAASGSDVISSALSYIPEMVWNDDSSTDGISSGGGGTSQFTARPSWQTGVTGIPSGSFRLVPDISLASSPNNAGYLYCSSDTQSTGITGSCSNGFRDSSDASLTVAGGTSFAAPIFAGMLAIINQSRNSTGQGVINPTLYTLASNSATYSTAFHDTVTGGNQCTAGSSSTTVYCNSTGASAYAAGTGYDEASGLGSVDLNILLTAWPTTSATTLQASSTTLSAATLSPTSGAADVITFTVAPSSTTFTTTPTGSLMLVVDGTTAASTLALTNGVATYTFTSTTAGAHVIEATYSGDSIYASSTGSLALSIGATTSSTGTFIVSAPSLTVADGSSGSSTVTVTPAGGYTGTLSWTLSTNASLTNACYTINNLTVPGTAAVTTSLTIATSSSLCASSSVVGGAGLRKLGNGQITDNRAPSPAPSRSGSMPTAVAFAGLLALLAQRRRPVLRLLLAVVSIGVLGFGLSGCGGSGSNTTTTTTTTTTTSTNATKGTYTLTLVGTDTANTAITASSTFTLTID
ncbi:protease pro-enzyme activation domain-containing protein [Granulicella sibirica]|uniref:protease pro-enzyme activation domain-containing protein n=1 Tax=Granulicella sibirica TaxID=2479048 RepID=UPI001F5020D4|nr:protease pro-enzyme activation domain-containing protein [Granulicella sibirica]